jgi:hypothetical protein
MGQISPRDASYLALLAEKPEGNSAVIKRAFFTLGSDAQQIAKALLGRQDVPEKARQTADGLREWVKANKTPKIRRRRRK